MKKLLTILLALLLCFSLTACKKDEKQVVKEEETTVVEPAVEDTTEVVEEVVEEDTTEKVEEIVVKDNSNQSYWVNFLNYDGSVLQRTAYKAGETPKYNGSTPTYSDGAYTYTFTGWDKVLSPVTMTQTYKATYSKVAIPQKNSAPVVVNPVAKTNLVYTDDYQDLITAGTGATFIYKIALYGSGVYNLTNNSGTDIPKGKKVGDYAVKYSKDGGTTWSDPIAVTIAKAKVDVPTAETGLAYTGSEQTGVLLPQDAKYTLSDSKATNAGNYIATATLIDKYSYEWNLATPTSDNQSILWSIAKATLTKDDLTFNAPTSLEYSGSAKSASFTNSKTHFGTIEVQYQLGDNPWSTSAPSAAGTYMVKAYIAEDANHNAVNLTDSTWAFTITPLLVNLPVISFTQTGSTLYDLEVDAADQRYVYSSGDTIAMAVGTYNVTVSLKDKTNTAWNLATPTSDDQAITWEIVAPKCQHINVGGVDGHICVNTYDAGQGQYACYTYNNDTGKLVFNGTTNGTIYFTNVNSTGWYYWDGAHYVKCEDQSDAAHPTGN